MLIYLFVLVIIYKCMAYENFDYMDVSTNVIKNINTYPSNSLDIFTDKEFKPECCPSLYTKSSGCMCENETNHDLLVMRGGNRLLKDTYVKQKKIPYLTEPICPQCDS
ncbi:hypothetical protein 162313553 [Organic Lake phycodnavirus 1]|jgi:hypothetical protein|nr:hypothetical protein 162313553 [Organic Lake phycodnavirus 1]